MRTSNAGEQMADEKTDPEINVKSLFGRNLKRLRTAAKISQIGLAAEADLAQNFINDIESGKKWVSASTIKKLACALKAEPYQFFMDYSKRNDQGAEFFSLCLDDFSDSMVKMVKEYRHRYISDDSGENPVSAGRK